MNREPGALESPPKGFHGMGAVIVFVGIAVMVSLTWTQWQQAQRRGAQVLEVHGKIPEFTFVDAINTGNFTLPNTNGNFFLLAALSTREGGVAPMLVSRMRELAQQLDRMGEQRVRFAVITNDPGHDTPAALAAFAAKVQAEPTRWSFFTGSAEELKTWIERDLFGPLLGEGEVFPAAPTRFVLIDPEGNIRAYRDAQNPGVVGNLLHDFGAMDREFPAGSGK